MSWGWEGVNRNGQEIAEDWGESAHFYSCIKLSKQQQELLCCVVLEILRKLS